MIGTRRDVDALIEARNEYREAYERAFYAEQLAEDEFSEYVSPRKIHELGKMLGLPVRKSDKGDKVLLEVRYRTCTFFCYENKEVA